MFYVSAFLYPAAVLLLAAGLLYSHVRAWRRAQQEKDDLEFSRRQFRRRVQTSAMLGLLAIGLCLGQLISSDRHPTAFVLFWSGMLLLLAWMVLLAVGDLVLGRKHVSRLQHERRIAEAQLNAEIQRVRDRLQQEQGDEA